MAAEMMERELPLKDKELPKEEGVTSGGGKKKRQKKQKSNKTQSLNDFLADSTIGKYTGKEPPKRMGSWADAMEERLDGEEVVTTTTWQGGGGGGGGGDFDRSQLPSAPRKAQARNVDRSRLPKAPPYTVYLGNLSYECNEDDIIYFFQRKNLEVKEVRLPTDSGTNRLKGFGYAELESVTALLEALELTGEMLRNRSVTIDLATSKSSEGDGGGRGDRYRRDSDDRTATDWRRGSGDDIPSRDYQNGPPSYNDRPYTGRGRYGDEFRGGGGGGYEGRGRRGYGSGGWNERPEYGRESYSDRQRDYQDGRRRQDGWIERDRRGPPRYRDEGYRRGRSPPDQYERPRLQLQPRSRPMDAAPSESRSSIFGAAQPVDTASREREIEEKILKEKEIAAEEEERAQREKELREEKEKEAVFGGAKPVDTASREREIEEKLRKKQEDVILLQKKQRERKWSSDSEKKGRGRKGSDRSWDGEDGGRFSSKSPERSEDGRLKTGAPEPEKKVEILKRKSSEGARDESGRGREGRHKERYRDDRGQRERSIEEDWVDGGRGVRKTEPATETQRDSDRIRSGGRRGGGGGGGGGRGRGGGGRGGGGRGGRVDERRDIRGEKRSKGRSSMTREDMTLRKFEEPAQPVFSQPSRYAMLENDGEEDEELNTESPPQPPQDD